MPIMQILHISNTVNPSFLLHHICILTQKSCINNSPSLFLLLKLGVRKTKEYFFNRSSSKILAQMFHSIGSDHPHCLACIFFYSQGGNLSPYIVDQLISNFKSEHKLIREIFMQREEQTSVPASNIQEFHTSFSPVHFFLLL